MLYAASQGDEGSIFICSKKGSEGSIYAARQGMRACNNNNMRNPFLHLFYYGVTHVITSFNILMEISFILSKYGAKEREQCLYLNTILFKFR